MEPGNKNSLAENMAIHRVDHRIPRIRGLLRRALRNIQFCIESVQFEGVVMIWPRSSARTHITITSKTDLTAAIRKFALRYAFWKSSRRCGDIPDQPVGDIHFRAFL